MRYAYQAYKTVENIAFVGRIRRSRRIRHEQEHFISNLKLN